MDERTFLKKQVNELEDKNLQLRSDVAYLKGKIEAYEWFLQTKGYIEEGEK